MFRNDEEALRLRVDALRSAVAAERTGHAEALRERAALRAEIGRLRRDFGFSAVDLAHRIGARAILAAGLGIFGFLLVFAVVMHCAT